MAFAAGGPAGSPPAGLAWDDFMDLALAEAELAGAGGDVPVGAIVIDRKGRVLAKAGNRVERDRNPVAHAEILALGAASRVVGSQRLGGCILVTTLEPCVMCAGAVSLSGIDGVIFGAADLRAGALVSVCDAADLPLTRRDFWRLGGVRSEKCAELLKTFFARRRFNPM